MNVRCLLVDDEPLALQVVTQYLEQVEDFEVAGTCESALEAGTFLTTHPVDLVFLDINMPMLSGLEFLKTLANPPLIVITTAYREYAVDSYELDVLDYLVKPIPFARFMKTLHKVREQLRLRQQATQPTATDGEPTPPPPPLQADHLYLKVDKKMIRVEYSDIVYVESLKDYVRVITTLESLIVHYNLQAFTDLLPPKDFARIHRSYTINLNHIKALDGNSIEIGGKSLPIGRNYQPEVKQRILGGN
ncbi:MAG TPA: DNA-binding response regulator [Cytophagales bacterium]|nr:DNA-binding response regulator [Cytophagales bacterium]HAA17649.1 DNA-binding response regulator [Cytophagales bacterium]HAP59817.1 DNA-binding response regulator [Cytophagales bacterium]